MADIRPDRLTICQSERKSVVSRRPSVHTKYIPERWKGRNYSEDAHGRIKLKWTLMSIAWASPITIRVESSVGLLWTHYPNSGSYSAASTMTSWVTSSFSRTLFHAVMLRHVRLHGSRWGSDRWQSDAACGQQIWHTVNNVNSWNRM
jgi:hypothetical protein